MPLSPGARLGEFTIVAPVGAGGMGEVYRAKDSRLDREVAIKVMPENVATDPERRPRFEREAKAVAALSHPNILAIHEFGVQGETAYAVMELLRGETLRDRLQSGTMTVRKATETAIQIARGLAAAHDKGVIHRDLKPENVFLLEDGQVKILDFGLAKNVGDRHHDARTMTVGTNPGTVMGTAGYMAPEQVRGLAADARADLFALGAVLYEMVSGQRAFKGDTAADTMTAILKEDPPELTGSRADLSPSLDRIIRHCLEKNPAERFQTARDVAFALGSLSATSISQGAVAPAMAANLRGWMRSAALVAITGVVAVAATRSLSPKASVPRFTQKTFDQASIITARFMPNGDTVIYSAARIGNLPQLFELRSGSTAARPFGPPATHLLSVSSQGELLVLTDVSFLNTRVFRGTLARMSIDGSPRPLMTDARDAAWAPDGSSMAVVRSSVNGDSLEYPAGTELYRSTTNGFVSDIRVSPDGNSVAFMDHQQRWDNRGWVKVVDRNKQVTTLAGEFRGQETIAWSSDGSTVYFSANDISDATGNDKFSVLIYQIRSARLSRPGIAEAVLPVPSDFLVHDVAADGRWLATRDDMFGGVGVHLADADEDRDMSYLNSNWSPWLSRDGSRLMFTDGTAGANYGVVWRKTDGSPVVHLGEGHGADFSPDGEWGVGMVFTPPTLRLYPLAAGATHTINLAPLTDFTAVGFSPDSKHILVTGHEPSGGRRTYRTTVPPGALTPALPPEVIPRDFRRDGREILAYNFPAKRMEWHPVDGGPPRPALGVNRDDKIIGWAADGTSPLVVAPNQGLSIAVEKVDTITGKREAFKTVKNKDYAYGVSSMSSDGRQYAYVYSKRQSTLFTVTGVK